MYAQNLHDVVLVLTGTTESLVEVASYNNISATDSLTVGQKIIIPDDVKIDEDIQAYYRAKKIQPATAAESEEVLSGGIGVMQINETFEIT